MKLTKFSHSCVRIEDGDRRLVVDPGVYSESSEALDGIDAVLLTHQHPDHLDVDTLTEQVIKNPDLHVWAPRDVIDQLAKLEAFDGKYTAVGAGQSFVVGGLQVRTFGGQHALIHSSLPVVSNVGYLIGDAVYHPGDSYTVPNAMVETLLVPVVAPWAKISETYDFVISVRAPKAFQIHDAIVNELGRTLYETHLHRIGDLYGTTRFQHLDPKQTVDL
jgi:L-ascorbate metabolism protein UlaG (beta-lactamase superfamily)